MSSAMMSGGNGCLGFLVAVVLAATLAQVSATPWCTAPPTCNIHSALKAEAEKRNLNLLVFPAPADNKWPNKDILTQCQYVAYCPGYQDGLGSQYIRILQIMGFTHLYNLSFVHLPLEKLDHHVNISEAEAFFNFAHDETPLAAVPDGATVCLANTCGFSAPMLEVAIHKLQEGSTKTAPFLPTFTPSVLNIAVHIRRGDVGNNPKDIQQGRYVSDQYYLDIIGNITKDISASGLKYQFHVFSEGLPQHFANITAQYPDMVWHLNEDPFMSLRGMMCSDILVKSPSSFSHLVSRYYFTGLVVEPRQGWHSSAHDSIKNWDTTRILLSQRVQGRRFMRGC